MTRNKNEVQVDIMANTKKERKMCLHLAGNYSESKNTLTSMAHIEGKHIK